MKNILILILMLAFAFANEPTLDDVLGGKGKNKQVQLKNGDVSGKNTLSKVSLWLDINVTNIKKFGIVPTEKISVTNINPYEKILLDGVSYGTGIHPSYAEIQATKKKLIFVFDANKTEKGENLIIGAGVLRDGDRGGALNSAFTVADDKIDDKAGPVVVSYKTVDGSGVDGKIDKIELTFSENVTIGGDANKSLVIGNSYKTPSATTVSSKVLTIPLTEKATYDTDIAPTISYNHTYKADHNLTDSLNNIVPVFNLTLSSVTVQAKDTVKPIVVSIGGKSKDATGDIIYLGFSEKITQNLKEGRISTSLSTMNLKNAIVEYQNNGLNATITLNETIDGQFAHGSSLTVKIETNATDLHKNSFAAYTSSGLTIAKETVKPKISSLIRFEDENKLTLTFNEPMDKTSVETESHYLIGGEHNIATLSISDAVQSTDKKSVLLTIGNFPAYSSNVNAVRKITIGAKPDIKDYVGNIISTSTLIDYNRTVTIKKDSVHPLATGFILNMKTGKLDISFDEKVVVGEFIPTTIDINTSYTDGKSLLTSKSKAIYSNKVINISLNEDIDRVKNFIKDKRDINLTIRSGSGIIDFNAKTYNGGNVSSAGFTPDDIKPKLISWEYDLDKKIFKLLFNEAMKVIDYDATKLKINEVNQTGSGEQKEMIDKSSNAKVVNKFPYRTVEINLLTSEVNSILANDKIGLDINTTHLILDTGSGITDSAGNDIAAITVERAISYESSENAVATLNVVPNRWNHISVDNNTTSNHILSTGKVSYIYGHDGSKFVEFPATLSSHKGYWIKTSNASGTTFPVPAIKNTKGNKEDDLGRIRSKIDGKFHLIGIENDVTYEEIQAETPSVCKSMRIHHYVSDTDKNKEGWDVNASLSANDALWVLCIK